MSISSMIEARSIGLAGKNVMTTRVGSQLFRLWDCPMQCGGRHNYAAKESRPNKRALYPIDMASLLGSKVLGLGRICRCACIRCPSCGGQL